MRAIRYIAVLCGITALSTHAVDLTNDDLFGTSSFNSDTNGFWNPAGAPSAGNDYTVNGFALRTPTDGVPYTFQGDSLTLQGGGTLLYKGNNSQIVVNGLNLNGGTVSTGQPNSTMTLAGTIAVGPGSGTFFAGDTGSRVINVNALISGNGPVISRGDNGGNDWVQFSNNNTYTGTTTVDNNYLVLTNSNALGGTASGTTVINSGTLQLNSTGVMAPEPLTLNGTGQNGYRGALGNWTGNNTWTGPINLASDSNIFSRGAGGVSLTISSQISGSGELTTTGDGPIYGGYTYLTGAASNTYTGGTVVDRNVLNLSKTGGAFAIPGNIQMGAGNTNQPYLRPTLNNQFAPGSVMTFANSLGNWTRFQLRGTSQILAGLQSPGASGVVEAGNGAASVLTLNGSGNYYFQGHMRNNTGAFSLVKNGSGTQILDALTPGSTSRVNYTGATTINDGTLVLRNLRDTNAANSFRSPVTVNPDGILEINSTIPFGTRWNYNQQLSGTGTINKTGAGVFGIYGVNTFDGQLNILEGRLHNDATSAEWSGATADVYVANGAVLDLRADDIRVDTLTGDAGSEIWNSHTAGGTRTLTLGVANGTNGIFDGAIRGIGGTGNDTPDAAPINVVKEGTGIQYLRGTNTYTGSTTINGGWLGVGATFGTGDATGSINGTSGVTLAGGNGIAFRRSNTYNFTPDISHTGGIGRILQQGAGNLVFDGNTVAGSQVRSSSGTVTIDNGATLTLSGFTEGMSAAGNRTVGLYIGQGSGGPYGFNLTNGTVTVNNSDVMLGESGGLTTANISAGGNLNINNGRYEVGYNGAIDVNQTGGDVTITNSHVVLGRYDNADVEYNMSGGTMITQGTGNQRIHMAWDRAASKADLNLSGDAAVTTNADGGNAASAFFIANNGTATVRVADDASLTINAQGDGTGGLLLGYGSGSGTLAQTGGTVTVNNNFIKVGRNGTGTMTVDGGTFTQQGSGNQNTYLGWDGGASTGNLNVGGTGVVTLGSNLYAGGNGDGVITVSDTGSLTVPGATILGWNAVASGTLNLNGGTLTTSALYQRYGSAAVNFDGGTLQAGDSFHTAIPATIGAGGATVDTNGNTVALTGNLSGAGGLTKTGTGELILAGNNSYTGTTQIDGGTLKLADSAPVAGSSFWVDATDLSTITQGGGGITGWANKAIPGPDAGDLTAVGQPTLSLGAINGNPAVQFTATNGADRLSNSVNYDTASAAATVFAVGRLTGGSNRRLVTATGNNWLMGWWGNGLDKAYYNGWVTNPSIAADTQPRLYTGTMGAGNSTLYSSGALLASNTGGTSNPNGITLGGWGVNGTENSNGQVGEMLLYPTALSSADRARVEAYLASRWFGSNTDNIPDTSLVSIGAAGTFDLSSHTETIGGLSGAAGSSVLLGSGTLTTGGNNTDNTFSGVISGTGNMVKTGSGTLTYGDTNTYTGTTTINGGTLRIGDGTTNGSLDGAVGPLTVGAGATLAFDRTDTVTFGRQLLGAPTALVEHNGSGTTILDNVNNTFTGRYDVNNGTLTIANEPAMGTPNRIHIESAAHFDASAIPVFKPNTEITGNGEIIVSALAGEGLDVGGSTMSPGNSPGTLTVTGNLVATPVYTYDWELLDSTSFAGVGGGWDLINVTGTADFAGIAALGDAVLNLSGIAANPSGIDPNIHEFEGKVTNLTILTATGGISNFDHNFWTINAGNIGSVADFTLAFSDANNLILTITSTIPEPSTYALMALILVAFGFYARRQTLGSTKS